MKKPICPVCKSSRVFYEVWMAKYKCMNCGFISPFVVEEDYGSNTVKDKKKARTRRMN